MKIIYLLTSLSLLLLTSKSDCTCCLQDGLTFSKYEKGDSIPATAKGDKATKVKHTTCFSGNGPAFSKYEKGDSFPSIVKGDTVFLKIKEASSRPIFSDFKLMIRSDGTFKLKETQRPKDPGTGITRNYAGLWRPLENGEILLIDGKEPYIHPMFKTAYDAATAKGLRRIDARHYVFNVSADSVYLGTNLWLHRSPCDDIIRLRKR